MIDWTKLDTAKFSDENIAANSLLPRISINNAFRESVAGDAVEIVRRARALTSKKGMMETFLEEFGLSNNEGLALMCLAESLLRVPDAKTADKLIAEKISSGDWEEHKGHSESWLVNASTLGLMLTGKVVDVSKTAKSDISGFMRNLTRRAGEPVIRAAMIQAMRIMGEQFVVGRTIDDALKRSESLGLSGGASICSFDMLGEGARTAKDADRYYKAYYDAIKALGAYRGGQRKEEARPEDINGISVKLSALHPRYEAVNEARVMDELYPKLLKLAETAADGDLNFCMDAEEADRLVLSLKIFDRLAREPSLGDWTGLGLAVQSYQKRSPMVIEKLIALSEQTGRRLMVRLVKGAYWDSEIKHAQVEGFTDFPVWTRKSTTDIAYLACARMLLDAGSAIYPQFATHNAHTVAAIEHMAKTSEAKAKYEFQRLHGMGEALYRAVNPDHPVRIYAPVGAHEDLLPYLVRRLLENGANTSFVHRFLDEDVAPEEVAKSPFTEGDITRHPRIPKPVALFGDERANSMGMDLSQDGVREHLAAQAYATIAAGPLTTAKLAKGGPLKDIFSPVTSETLGTVRHATVDDVQAAAKEAFAAFPNWNGQGGIERGKILRAMGDALEAHMDEFITLMSREAGKSLPDCIAEIREAVDFCRFYGAEAERKFSGWTTLPGPAGETNELTNSGRGVFVCISPWNFPLAIFAGQIAAALAAGNTVLAKPAEQTPLTAYRAVQIFQQAGLPKNVLHLLPGEGDIGALMVDVPNIAGVCFTGSTQVAKIINQALAQKDGPIPVLIAETGGLNGMFVDTTALREQVMDDVIQSAFNAAGQRCSALRILFLPEETADHIIEGLSGAMDELSIGNPASASTDVGPVITENALSQFREYIAKLPPHMQVKKQVDLPPDLPNGFFMPPTLIKAKSLEGFDREIFGPILHVVTYKDKNLDKLMAEFAGKGYGLTLGIHSRLDGFAARVMSAVPAGNIYINRNVIGAVVGVQPFGGLGLSGTGPKAGGSHYVARFATEITRTNNITAQGGDPALLNLSE